MRMRPWGQSSEMPARLSALDASFLEVETPTAHMHVGWVVLFDPPAAGATPTFHSIRRHVESRLQHAPRYRQRLAFVPLGIHDPVWVDDQEFDVARHVRHSAAHDVDRLVERVFSTPLDRAHPLWELWIADQLPGGGVAVVGKAHHCMVDGIAAVELASLFMDLEPAVAPEEPDQWRPRPAPGSAALLATGVRDRLGDELDLVRLPARIARSPRRVAGLARDTVRASRSLAHSLSPTAPPSVLNQEISPMRSLARASRPMDELRETKRRHGVTVNDIVLAVSAGAMRRYMAQHGEPVTDLKAMVPVNVRGEGAAADLGNQLSFLFLELPCSEPDPVRRLEDIHALMEDRKATGEPRGSKAVLDSLRYAPHPLQHAMSRAVAAPRTYNVTVSNVPGPPQPLYLMGCPLREAYPIVPLSDRHGVSVGFTSVAGVGCFGVYADRRSVPDASLLAHGIERELDELRERAPAGTRVPE